MFDGFDLERRIVERASRCGLDLDTTAVAILAGHARAVATSEPHLHLTTIQEPEQFLERHIGESLEGAALIPESLTGKLLDLGSGNGYPGIGVAAVRRGLTPFLAEASTRKAAFLLSALGQVPLDGAVIDRQIQRASDLEPHAPFSAVLSRAMGGWEKIIPRLLPAMDRAGTVLLWAGEDVERVATRNAWSRLRLVERRPLPGRERSWVWQFALA